MFSNLRQNSQVYILHKDSTPYIEIGSVVSVSQPVPRFPMTNFAAPQELVVDVTVRINTDTVVLSKLPANLDITEQVMQGVSLLITTSREAMNSEIDTLRQKSLGVLNSIDYHKKLITDYETLLQTLNPEFAEQKQQKQEIDNLKMQMMEMMSSIKELTEQLRQNNKTE